MSTIIDEVIESVLQSEEAANKKRRVIFLDVDGPLCNYRSHIGMRGKGGQMRDWDIYAANIIKRCCENDNRIKIVMSSTWRREYLYNTMIDKLKEHNLFQHLYEEDFCTPIYNDPDEKRGDEIKGWLDNHPEVVDYIIVDDDIGYLHEDQLLRVIKSDCCDGLSSENFIKMYEWSIRRNV